MPKKFKVIIIISISMFLASLMQEAFTVNSGKESIGSFGLTAFLMGLFNASQTWICWFANPLYILACIYFFSKEKLALFLSCFTVVLSGLFYFFDEVLINEGGTVGVIDRYKTGYWLWAGSHFLLFIASVIRYRQNSLCDKEKT